MPNPEVVAYLRSLINKHPVDELRKQLAKDGISDADFDEALKFVLRTPLPKERKPSPAGKIFLFCGLAIVLGTAGVALFNQPSPKDPQPRPQGPEGAFLGKTGYVIRLPEGYEATISAKDFQQALELVHFCKRGTDPTNFVHEGLFGQLGIVRLEVETNRFADSPAAFDQLGRFLDNLLSQRGDKYSKKPLQVSTLKAYQVTIETPFQRTEAYVLGEKVLYVFTAGQDDEIFREIVMSLRETETEM
ncbi:MAG: hypothetical protein HY927_16195 [Elusimicrobia bacterium]|nr:hypothetical protein [Elusimicrobiota bacterium]